MSWSPYTTYIANGIVFIFSFLGDQRGEEEFTNVGHMWAYEDGRQAEAHKVVLALSIPCIKCLPKQNMHHHPNDHGWRILIHETSLQSSEKQ